ncbi:class A beta-lactamase-related serine hydrolase [Agromyces protaetiae]|uniref:Class A beta-lactamase-related serine hydrolase n=1 Tax=Agromyces protaetiae TaxID=2509455 RepID=A0A4P6FFX3_9MICO|nr:serine hydrolase domain-containing protein [Agromyces protaetiae]QAY72697.1 class A beta-lactamase-related serine hydrolase [Agromyces protaetiae]
MTGCIGGTVDPEAQFGGTDAAIPVEVSDALDAALANAVALSGASGGLAAIDAPWAGEWRGVAGTESFDEHASAVAPDDSFRLAGVTGEVTCLILLRLADAEVVGLADPVSEHVDGIPGLDGITLEQLCRHTSGLADYYPSLRTHFAHNPERVWSQIELISNGMALDRVGTPGEKYSYSRTGLLLLGVALERATNRSWNDLAEQYVFEPLGLDGTELPSPTDVADASSLDGYLQPPGADGNPVCDVRYDVSRLSSSSVGAAGGAISTLDDTVTISQAFATGSLLGEKTAREQWATEHIPDQPSWVSEGVGGLEYGPLRGISTETAGAVTAAFTDPGSGLTVVLTLNSSTAGPDFAREAAFALASIASKAPGADGAEAPLVELPWSIDQANANLASLARCATAPPAEAPPAEAPAEG